MSNAEEYDPKDKMLDRQRAKSDRIRESDHSQVPSVLNGLWFVSLIGFLIIYGDILFDGIRIVEFITAKNKISHHYNGSEILETCEGHLSAYQFSHLALAIAQILFLSFISVLSHIKNLRIAAQVFILLEELCQTIILALYRNHCLCKKYSSDLSQSENVLEQWTLILGSILGSIGPILMYLGDRYKSRAARRISGWHLRCWINVIDVLVLVISLFCSIAIVLSTFCL